eukprot:TRINITY_DN82701_c0_g1_i1.p1 TRINITY_DN82701_c0_g1~~TRINITY_DN82701_c0_g1_i1.p1  ORF type:complete len:190 (-),score=1.45 TRINITY_DN82701_c0_g1_i1:59-628(-)
MPLSRYAKRGTERFNGTLQTWNMPARGRRNAEGFGFVVIDGKQQDKATDLFLYADAIVDAKLRSQAKIFGLKPGTRLSFVIEEAMAHHESGKAVEVRPADGDKGDSGGGRGSKSRRSRSRNRRSRSRRSRSRSRRRSNSRKRSPSRRRSPSQRRSPSRRQSCSRRRRSPSQSRSPSRRRRSQSGRSGSR